MKTLYAMESVKGPWLIGYQRGKTTKYPHVSLNFKKRHVTLKVPGTCDMAAVESILGQRRVWINGFIATLQQNSRPLQIDQALVFPLRGEGLEIAFHPGLPEASVKDGVLYAAHKEQLGAWLRAQTRLDLLPHIETFSQQLGVVPDKIAIRDTKSRWGSCSSNRTLSFSWRIIMAPPQVLRYLAAHEVAHLKHMDHSPDFWAAVNLCMPDWMLWRDWLTLNGFHLMRYQLVSALPKSRAQKPLLRGFSWAVSAFSTARRVVKD